MSRMGLIALCLLALGLAFGPAPARAEYGDMARCLMGCLPGVNNCTHCCKRTFGKVQGPCEEGCLGTLQACRAGCTAQYEQCAAKHGSDCTEQHDQCAEQCRRDYNSCDMNCGGIKTNFNCPDWVDPHHKCPYKCQVWNPTSRSCVGAERDDCP